MESLIDNVKSLVAKMPDPDKKGMFSVVDAEAVQAATSKLNELGPNGLVALLDLLGQQDPGDDFKARYALHCIALLVSKENDLTAQQVFSATLATQLDVDRPDHVKSYVIQELQAVGGAEVLPALGKALGNESLCETAAQALTAIGGGAASQFRAALKGAKGGCELTILQNLGVLRDADAIDLLKPAATDKDAAIRQTALWALANIGDVGSVDIIVKAADGSQNWERVKATKTCLLLAERLLEQGKKKEAAKVYTHLTKTRTDPSEQYIRDAAASALAAAK
jgi:HEAT repeat protein